MTATERRLQALALQFALPSDAALRLEISDRELRVLTLAALDALFRQQREGSVNTPGLKASITVGAASTQVVPANAGRTWLCLVNTGEESVSLGFGAAAEQYKGVTLSPNGGTFVMDAANLYRGIVYGIGNVGSGSTIACQEFTR